MIFLSVGSEYPFDRLVRAVDKLIGISVVNEEVFAQIGRGQYKPCHMTWVSTMEKRAYDQQFEACRAVISHAGMGTIIKSLELRKPLLAMPRLKRLGEIISDHQLACCRKFEARGDILACYDVRELPQCIEQLNTFCPSARQMDANAVVDYIEEFLRRLELGSESSQ